TIPREKAWPRCALGLTLFALLMMAVVLPVLVRSVSLDYSEQISRIMVANTSRAQTSWIRGVAEFLTSWANRLFLAHAEERAFFYFLLTMLRRNRKLKLQVYPNFGVAV